MSSQLLEKAFAAASPRISPRPSRIAGQLVHALLVVAWVILFMKAFFAKGLLAWSSGIAYVCYDTVLLIFVAWKTWPMWQRAAAFPRSAPSASSATPSLAVLIAAHNEAAVLPVILDALRRQTHAPDRILILDDGSSDNTAEWLAVHYGLQAPALGACSEPAQDFPVLRWLRLPHGGKARALNAGLLQVTEEVLLTVDADTLLDADACRQMVLAFAQQPGLVAAGGILTPACAPTWSGRYFQWFQTYEYIRNFVSRYAWMRTESLLLISGAFAGFRRAALIDVGGFDPHCLVEDYELIHRLQRHSRDRQLGWQVRIVGGAHGKTDAPASLPAFLRQRRRWFAGFLQTQYWNRDMIANPRYGALGMLMLPVKAFDTMQPVYGLTAFVLLIWLAVSGQSAILAVSGVIGAKIVIDLGFHLWTIVLYRRWTAIEGHRLTLWQAFLTALIEPFSFQLMRHTGAVLGWLDFLTRRRIWGVQQRAGIVDLHSDDELSSR